MESKAPPPRLPPLVSPPPPRPPPLVSPPPPHNPTAAAPTTTSSPQSPIVIHGKYVLTRLLGRGSFAKVYLGRSLLQTDSSSVAIKVFDKEKIDSSMAPRLLREIDAMRRLTHPNIIRIHEVLATKSKIYLVMDLAPGGDLLGKLSRRQGHRLPDPISRRYFRQLVSALRYCHLTGVAHRDLKPQNILLDHNGDLKISDFGLSAVAAISSSSSADGLASLRTACGTPAFAAPEVVGRSRLGYDGEKADAWSCGVILFAMLAGALPFDDGNLASMYRKMQRREVHFPPHVTRPARSLIMKLLEPNPATRMSVDEITNDPWYKGSQNNTTTSTMRNCVSLGDLVSVMDEGGRGGEFERPERAVVSKSCMNAFDIISMSSGLDLSGLLDDEDGSLRRRRKDKERRFTTSEPAGALVEKVIDVAGKLGYEVQRGKAAGKVWLGKGRLVLIVEALEVGPEVSVAELRVVETNGSDSGFWMEEVQWGEWKNGLGEIVTSWHDERMI